VRRIMLMARWGRVSMLMIGFMVLRDPGGGGMGGLIVDDWKYNSSAFGEMMKSWNETVLGNSGGNNSLVSKS